MGAGTNIASPEKLARNWDGPDGLSELDRMFGGLKRRYQLKEEERTHFMAMKKQELTAETMGRKPLRGERGRVRWAGLSLCQGRTGTGQGTMRRKCWVYVWQKR